jgi:protein TonB
VFDEVTRREGGKRAARRGAWVAVSTGAQALLVLSVIAVSARIAAEVREVPTVDVKFVKPAAPPPPPPPPPPAPRRKPPPKPRTEAPKPRPSPLAMVQPKDIPQELKPPDPNEPPEPELEEAEGVEGGVVGGVVGSTGSAPPQSGGIEDAPVYAGSGYRQPREQQPGCVSNAVRIPRELTGFVSALVVKFSVNRDGSVSLFQVMSPQQVDPRVAQAVWSAIQSCRWQVGTDPAGRPQNIWVSLPLRFKSG